MVIPDVKSAAFSRSTAINVTTITCSFRAAQRTPDIFGDSQEGVVSSRGKNAAGEDSKDKNKNQIFHVNKLKDFFSNYKLNLSLLLNIQSKQSFFIFRNPPNFNIQKVVSSLQTSK